MAEELRAALIPSLALAALTLCGGCAGEARKRDAELTQLLSWLPGNYDNRAEARGDARGAPPPQQGIALTIVSVYAPRLGHHVLYAQESAADDPRRVMSERMLSFTIDEKRGILETVYTFVEPRRWRDGQEHPELFTGVVPDDVRSVPGCELSWKQAGERLVATQDGKLCREAAAAGAPAAALTADSLELAGYRFHKTR